MIHTLIRNLRKELGYTQQMMADHLHISQNAYSFIENGRTRLDVERLQKIAQKLNVEVMDLFARAECTTIKTSHHNDLLIELLAIKDKQIQQLIHQNLILLLKLEKKNAL